MVATLDTPDLRQVTDLAPTAPPWRLANRLDETRRVRLAGAWATQFHALCEAGANLVFAPSMSQTLMPFGGPVAQLVGSTQAVVVVANNPADWSHPDQPDQHDQPGRALFGHPGFAQQTRQVHAPDRRSGIALLRVGSGHLRWQPGEPDAASQPAPADGIGDAPAWVRSLAPHTSAAGRRRNDAVTLRPAAVLTVLTDGPGGPHVLLTARAPDLTHYSGQLVFPGGAAADDDRDAIDTALREAREEIGLDPTSVHVIGALPALGLPDSGFLVTPIVAWSHQPRYLHPANPAEVTTVRTVPLVARRDGQVRRPDVHVAADDAGDDIRVGVMTTAIIELLAAYLAAAPDARGTEPCG